MRFTFLTALVASLLASTTVFGQGAIDYSGCVCRNPIQVAEVSTEDECKSYAPYNGFSRHTNKRWAGSEMMGTCWVCHPEFFDLSCVKNISAGLKARWWYCLKIPDQFGSSCIVTNGCFTEKEMIDNIARLRPDMYLKEIAQSCP